MRTLTLTNQEIEIIQRALGIAEMKFNQLRKKYIKEVVTVRGVDNSSKIATKETEAIFEKENQFCDLLMSIKNLEKDKTKNNQMIESQSATTFSEVHKNETKTFFEIVDADWDMYHPYNFETEEEARKVIREEYENRSKNDGNDKYWRKRKQIVVKVTLTKEVLG